MHHTLRGKVSVFAGFEFLDIHLWKKKAKYGHETVSRLPSAAILQPFCSTSALEKDYSITER